MEILIFYSINIFTDTSLERPHLTYVKMNNIFLKKFDCNLNVGKCCKNYLKINWEKYSVQMKGSNSEHFGLYTTIWKDFWSMCPNIHLFMYMSIY